MNKFQLLRLSIATILWWTVVVFAAEYEGAVAEQALAPEIPGATVSGEALESEVTIIRHDKTTVTEYRINGKLYKIKIIPPIGAPYYLIDREGDGVMERRSGIDDDMAVPRWVLFSW